MTTKKIILLTCLTMFCSLLPAEAQWVREYTEERPLIIVSDWEFPPYEFRNDDGEADGYNVEVLDLILNTLKVPHKYVMQEWYLCTKTFENREADLIHALTINYRKHPYVMTQNMITYYPVKLVRRKSQKAIHRLSELTAKDTLMVKNNDYVALRIQEIQDKPFHTEYRSPREALSAIRNGHGTYYVWGEMPLKMKIREYGLDSLLLDDIDIPAGELRIIGYDKELIDAIDDEYARLEQSGDLEVLRDKWFHPERHHDDTSPVALIVLAGALVAVIIGLLMTRLVRARVRQAVHKTEDLNHMMEQALNMGKYYVFTIDVVTGQIHNIHGDLLPEGEMVRDVFLPRIDKSDQDDFQKKVDLLISGELQQARYTKRLNIGSLKQPKWIWLSGLASLEYVDFKPRYITNTARDITQQVEDERVNTELNAKYMKIFETNIIAMSFYDSEGNLIDLNDNMRKLCEITQETEAWFFKTSFFDTPLINGQYQRGSRDEFHACQHITMPQFGVHKYIEIRIKPICDDNNKVKYYVTTAREVTDERNIYLEQLRHNREMEKTNAAINEYETRLQYLLDNSQMFIWNFYPDSGKITYTYSSRKNEFSETIEQFFEGIDDENKEQALADIKADLESQQPYDAIHHFRYTPLEKHPVWYAISGIPTFDKNGRLTNYFGIARNITFLMDAQEQLKRETSRAEDSGRMKSAFLANMTHEIRTPLNAIVGFSDLLPMIDTQEERMEFIRIIRNNCDMLMRLINDILEASSMGQALAIKPTECDFSLVFEDICQTLAQRVQEPGVEFIKDNPYPTCPTVLDKGRVQQVLTNFVTNAVKYTHQGFIKVGYHWDRRMKFDGSGEADGLTFYCLDTGAGIPKDKQASVFERFVKLNEFVQGTGLGLSICQNIVERCNGRIGVTSEGEGRGSTFWFWIPCERKIINLPGYDTPTLKA